MGAARVNCQDEHHGGDRPEEQRDLQTNSVAPACEIDNRQEEQRTESQLRKSLEALERSHCATLA